MAKRKKPNEGLAVTTLKDIKKDFKPSQPVGLASLSVRVPPDVLVGLRTASGDRLATRIMPYTQQDIVIDALRAWLKKNGYMKG